MKGRPTPACANCAIKDRICTVENGRGPKNCPSIHFKGTIDRANLEYEKPDVRHFARVSSIQEARCYREFQEEPGVRRAVKTRVEEVIEFSRRIGYRKLGIAFCGGLREEARRLQKILVAQGFEVASVRCKAGTLPKEALDLSEDDKIHPGQYETMCSPIAQAMILNDEGTDFNILVGLCVGHDYLFFKYAAAPTTVLVTKDRVMGHNPAAALYLCESYYTRLMNPPAGGTKA